MIIAGSTFGGTALQNAPIQLEGPVVGAFDGTVRWTYTQLDGWWESAPWRDRMVERPGHDGSFDAVPLRTSRIITLGGWVRANSRGDAARAVEQLQASGGLGGISSFGVFDPDLGFRQVQVRLSGTPLVDASNLGAGLARFSVMFKSPDHRKYGANQYGSAPLRGQGTGLVYPLKYPLSYGAAASGGVLTFTNSGTAPTEPVFTVSGPLASGFQITYVETGQHLTYSAQVGSDVVVDCAAGTATTQGQDRTVFLSQRDWFSVPPSNSATFVLATLGTETPSSAPTVQMSAQFAPAYL